MKMQVSLHETDAIAAFTLTGGRGYLGLAIEPTSWSDFIFYFCVLFFFCSRVPWRQFPHATC